MLVVITLIPILILAYNTKFTCVYYINQCKISYLNSKWYVMSKHFVAILKMRI